jgi:hypothetical protein
VTAFGVPGARVTPCWHDFETVAATSLSDIVCGFHVAGCCIETTSDPASCLVLRDRRTRPELRVWSYRKPQSPSSTFLAIATRESATVATARSIGCRVVALIAWAPRGTRKGLVGQSPLPVLRSLRYGSSIWRRLADRCFAFRVPHSAIRIPNQFVAIELPPAERFSPHSSIRCASSKIV